MEFSRQEYWSGSPFPPPGDVSDPGIKAASPVSPASPALADSLPLSLLGSPISKHPFSKWSICFLFLVHWKFSSQMNARFFWMLVSFEIIMWVLFFIVLIRCYYFKWLSQSMWGLFGASLVAQRLKHLPGMRETRVWSLGWEDPLEEEMATHSSTLAWRIPWREEPGRLQSMGLQRAGHEWATLLTYLLALATHFKNIKTKVK